MYHYTTGDLDKKTMYKFLSGSIIPRAIGWITTLDEKTEVVNAAPYSFTSGVSKQVALLSMAILRGA
uniref:flavin reductase family protein n=1 Tax=Jeotgalibaca porci TaxID=1868793 RepID=UPI0035A14CD3